MDDHGYENTKNDGEYPAESRAVKTFFVPLEKVHRIGMMNIKISIREKRQAILDHVLEISELDVCLFIDTGLDRMGNESMENLAGKKDYSWISVAKRRKNGGLGFLAKKEVKAEDLKLNEDNIIGLKIHHHVPVFVFGVYRSPKTNFEDTMRILSCEIARRQLEGKVLVMGDFNARIGEEPSVIYHEAGNVPGKSCTEFNRESSDKIRNKEGKELLSMMNALNLIVINGVTQPAEFTCTQYSGSSVIDLVIAEHDILSCVGDFQVWEDDWSVGLSDHRLVSFELDLK